jgi:hypothetical protein
MRCASISLLYFLGNIRAIDLSLNYKCLGI